MAEPYKIGETTTDVMLEILNLDKKEVISIEGISNQEFSEVIFSQLLHFVEMKIATFLSCNNRTIWFPSQTKLMIFFSFVLTT